MQSHGRGSHLLPRHGRTKQEFGDTLHRNLLWLVTVSLRSSGFQTGAGRSPSSRRCSGKRLHDPHWDQWEQEGGDGVGSVNHQPGLCPQGDALPTMDKTNGKPLQEVV